MFRAYPPHLQEVHFVIVTKLIVTFRNFANEPKNGTNTLSAVRRETLALTNSVSSRHGPIHWTAGRVTSVISGLLHESFSKSDILINVNFELRGVRAMVGTVSRLLFTAESQVRSHDLCCRSITAAGRASCVYSTARTLRLWQGYMTTCISAFFLY